MLSDTCLVHSCQARWRPNTVVRSKAKQSKALRNQSKHCCTSEESNASGHAVARMLSYKRLPHPLPGSLAPHSMTRHAQSGVQRGGITQHRNMPAVSNQQLIAAAGTQFVTAGGCNTLPVG
eukprot:191726-Chlamydomonas_euryale.AAC.3